MRITISPAAKDIVYQEFCTYDMSQVESCEHNAGHTFEVLEVNHLKVSVTRCVTCGAIIDFVRPTVRK